jgi:uncharacterized membrane protein
MLAEGEQLVVLLATFNPAVLTTFKVLHILSAIYFGLGVLISGVLTFQVPNTPGLPAKARTMEINRRVVLMMVIPGSLIAGIFGFIVTYGEGLGLHTKWILLSTILFVVAFLVGGASGPISARARRLVEAEANSGKRPSAELAAALRSPVPYIFTGIMVLLFAALVVLMFAQPR